MKKTFKVLVFCLIINLLFSVNILAHENKENIYVLFNNLYVNDKDLISINEYINIFDKEKYNITLLNVEHKSNKEIYELLQQENNKNKIDIIQILGIESNVPSFSFDSHVSVGNVGFVEQNLKTDYFYCNLNNNYNEISRFKVKNKNELNIDFKPLIKVIRLPISNGDYTFYINKFKDYLTLNKSDFDFQGFYKNINLDFKNKDKFNFKYLFEKTLKLKNTEFFSNKEFKVEHIDNSTIKNYYISYHGSKNGVEDFINIDNYNNYLSNNYFNMALISCNIIKDIDNKNIIYNMMAKGKNIYNISFSSSYYLYNDINYNSVASLKNSKFFYYVFYEYYNNLYNKQMNNTNSYFEAIKDYTNSTNINELLNQDLNNLIFMGHYGLVEP